jgi:isocitrate dehydrogenase
VQSFVGVAGVKMSLKDISLTGRILANFPANLTPEQRVNDELAELGKLARSRKRISSSCRYLWPRCRSSRPQSRNCRARAMRCRITRTTPPYDAVKRQNPRPLRQGAGQRRERPVLREGDSDRRAAGAVKRYARNNPHKMGAWCQDFQIACSPICRAGISCGSEPPPPSPHATNARIELVAKDGGVAVLKAKTPSIAGEISPRLGDEPEGTPRLPGRTD